MKKYTLLLYTALLLVFCSYLPDKAQAQNTNLPDQECFYASPDGCITLGYQSVTPHVNLPGESQNPKLDVEIIFQACTDVTEIRLTPTQGQAVILTGNQIQPGVIQTYAFVVNENSFKDGKLKLTIEFTSGQRVTVDIIWDEALDCGALIPLAVELTSFTGLPTQNGITLNWSTASEENNSHFEVERSADGQAFEQIAKVNGNGNSSIAINYTYLDINPLQGTNYYRLKQVDYDGQFEYSKTIAVSNDRATAMQVTMAPNPCRNGNCEVLIRNSRETRQTLLELKDMSGKVVLTKLVQRGAVQLSPDELRQYKGLFILTATSGDEVVHQRVILE
ncbi:hypothetical protein ABID22_002699 [Pontibacter aydingkolensis]|uniref:T9SS type A sorting domain-containing protein n=1 Tax=Pontibacter aydingkolensis TaxID=1911536 RepID=A0ABS7CWZ9_9BACT|nr:T9SS type A sorting domain-containing protein [Pontibacter aydingkolensis]MBW7468340.1 T9SS type A sorting domain-containing protein [Pontibacter aydingkolensis]